MALLCCGEILWDDFGDRRLLGGATFNVAAHAHRLGLPVHFVSAVGADPPGREALAQVAALGLETRFIRTVAAPTAGSQSGSPPASPTTPSAGPRPTTIRP